MNHLLIKTWGPGLVQKKKKKKKAEFPSEAGLVRFDWIQLCGGSGKIVATRNKNANIQCCSATGHKHFITTSPLHEDQTHYTPILTP